MFETVNEYLGKLNNAEAYAALDEPGKVKAVFSAEELLKDHFPPSSLSDRVIALQVLYMLEGEDEEFSKYKRHGVKSFSTKGISVTFEGSGISPDVITILRPSRAGIGRLI
ncbi:hypothetical protein ACFFJY_09320 [Fictibacillus aquaticus]|uniref:Uncharacterized protein n=1 Tax=Fictibacillus aquaticus TaxID=2021314 RepID=A0A235FBS3_9BACL|nr:hypothetical protein [Fictibacillus aquaticus]OYD58474.1 hypothetical protein CGZ90_00810 [Fictibacillus aquaticus]